MTDVVRCGDDLAGRVAAPFWLLTWLLTLGTFGRRLPWDTRHVQHERLNGMAPEKEEPEPVRGHLRGYQPTKGCDASNPPQGGSGVSRHPDLLAQVRACYTSPCDHDWLDVTEIGGPRIRVCGRCFGKEVA